MDDSLKKAMSEFFSLSPLLKQLFASSLVVNICFELVKILPPFFFTRLLDSLIVFDPAKGVSFSLVAVLVGAYFVSLGSLTACEVLFRHFVSTMISNTEADVLTRITRKLLSLDTLFHEQFNTGANINKIIKGSDRLVEFLYRIFDNVTPIAIQSVITLIILVWASWEVALTYVVFASIYACLMLYDAKITQKARERYTYCHSMFVGEIAQSIINIRTVKDFNNEAKELGKSKKWIDRYVEACQIRHRLSKRAVILEGAVQNTARVVTLALGVYLLVHQRFTPGLLVFIVTLTEKAYINLGNLSVSYFRLQDSMPSISAFSRLMRQHSAIKDDGDSAVRIEKGAIEFDRVSFRYDSRNRSTAAVKGLSFRIPDRSVTALVGRSGAGKSTIVKLLFRHFDPTAGSILIDGVDARKYSLENLRGGLALVSQDVELFNQSVFENIAYGAANASEKDVVHAAKMAYAHEFIMAFPRGYDTRIGERGVRLSGGQKQRLAIARALVRKPKILVFDEATSSLDAESEKYIHQSIVGLIGKMTLVIIAHRFSTIARADRIILLDNGELKEVGSHQELLRKKGIFARLRRLQELGDLKT